MDTSAAAQRLTPEALAARLRAVRERAPLVHCITNFVTVNDCANVILAAGGRATMPFDIREVEDAVSGADALVLNLGAVWALEAMILAGKRANALGIPVVLDPVAAGATGLRREAARRLLEELRFAAVRGNASEIRTLVLGCAGGSGVEVAAADAVTEASLPRAVELCRRLARDRGTVAVLSGPTDIRSDGETTLLLRNGCATMSRITGSGCMASSLVGAFSGAGRETPLAAAAAAMAVMGISGEKAEALRLKRGTGNASFRTDLIDSVFNLTEQDLKEGVRLELYQG